MRSVKYCTKNSIIIGDFGNIVGEGSTDKVVTTDHDDDVIENMYDEISEILHQECHNHDQLQEYCGRRIYR